jgi:hypothetical protein
MIAIGLDSIKCPFTLYGNVVTGEQIGVEHGAEEYCGMPATTSERIALPLVG